jgi:parallel beta-helix repeat protein
MKKFFLFYSILFFAIILITISCKKGDNSAPIDNYKDYKFEEPEITGHTFYIDPINGSANGDGSVQKPWRTLQEVIENGLIETYQHSENNNPSSDLVIVNEGAPVKGGDRLLLRSGYYGFVSVSNFIFKDWLTIEGESGHEAILSQFKANGAFKNFYLKNLTIKKDSYEGAENYWAADDITHNTNACLYLGSSDFWGKGESVKVNGLTLKTTDDISGWDEATWSERVAGGVSLRSVENVEVYNCHIENISLGISIEYMSDYAKIVGNTIQNYSLDGARLISNNVFFAYNTIKGCYKIDDNHDDAIQSYSRGEDNSPGTGVLYNNVVRGNLIIGINGPDQPLAGTPQGIGCFDGFFDGWIVENNVVITNHYHGITFMGMRNSKIANNTVIDQIPGDDLSPWIRISNHKNGSPSENCLIINNLAMRSINVEGNNVTERNNYVIGHDNYSQLTNLFTNPSGFDLNLLTNELTLENIIDKGEKVEGLVSSDIDKDQNVRTLPPDIGAFEAK